MFYGILTITLSKGREEGGKEEMGRREEKEEKDITEPIQKSGKKPFQEHEVYDVAQPFADE